MATLEKADRPAAGRQEAGKRRVNVTIRADILDEARALGTNISAVLEGALEAENRRRRQERWKEQNRAAMDAWNEWIEENGIPFEQIRAW